MKNTLYLLIILSFSNCNNRRESLLKLEKKSDSNNKTLIFNKKENLIIEKDTLVKKSKNFVINGLKCYWEFTLIISKGEKGGSSLVNLKNIKTNKIMLSNSDYCSLEHYNNIQKNNFEFNGEFKDINFDSLQDFFVYSRQDSGSGGAFYNTYLFNKATNTFALSEKLSGGELNINIKDKTVSYYWKMGVGLNSKQVYHFSKNGEIKFVEITTREVIFGNTNNLLKTTYKKVIDDKITKTKIDTIKYEQ